MEWLRNLLTIRVECKNNLSVEPNPRTKCWKVSVPYLFKDIMEKDEFFPSGWSHRRWYSGNGKNSNQNKKARQDPILDLINENGEGGSQAGGQVNADATIPKIVVTGSDSSQTGEGAEQNQAM